MNYDAAIEYLLSFADFERTGHFQERPDVAPMLSLLRRLGDPHLGKRTVHVAGSKGKGSVSAMVESILRASGQRTGLYTSPHLHDFTERIAVEGEAISRQTLARLVDEMRPAVEAEREAIGERSFVTFDLLTALGFVAFREAGVEAQVVEVGLGGRVDSTNVFGGEVGVGFNPSAAMNDESLPPTPPHPEKKGKLGDTPRPPAEGLRPSALPILRHPANLSTARLVEGCALTPDPARPPRRTAGERHVVVITPLSFEHTAVLGERIEQIAAEKAAIMTPGCVAVLAPQPYAEAADVVREFAAKAGARLVDVAAEYRWSIGEHNVRGQTVQIDGPDGVIEARLPLLGGHQAENAATAVAAARALDVVDGAIVRGLESVRWPGRVEVLSEEPLVVADGAHNADSARRLRETLIEYFGAKRVTFVIGAGDDKDVAGLVEELAPIVGLVIATHSKHPRAMEAARVAEAFARAGVPAEDGGSVSEAIERALATSGGRGLICLAGSLFVAAEGREHFNRALFPVED